MNLPPAPVYGMVIQEHFNDLVVGTYGRGFWILDDLSPLQQLTADVVAAPAPLFAPRAAYRFRGIAGNVSSNDDPTAGSNPPDGAAINYWLKAAARAVSIAILDGTGTTIRTLQGSRQVGLNRVFWDLRNEATPPPRLRTKPLFNAEFQLDSNGTRPAPEGTGLSVLMPPGRYTVRLTVDDKSYTRTLEVRRDPNIPATDAEIRASTELLRKMQADVGTTGEMINTIETARSQLQALVAQLASDRTAADIRAGGDSLEQKFMNVEQNLFDLRLTGRGQDAVRYPVKLAGQLSYLAGGVAASDFAPTVQQRAVQATLGERVRANRQALDGLIQRDLAAFNSRLTARGLKAINLKAPVVF
jgi:hypothetical protein